MGDAVVDEFTCVMGSATAEDGLLIQYPQTLRSPEDTSSLTYTFHLSCTSSQATDMILVTKFNIRKYQQYLSNGSRIIDASTASEKSLR
jgi:hypothetical protein